MTSFSDFDEYLKKERNIHLEFEDLEFIWEIGHHYRIFACWHSVFELYDILKPFIRQVQKRKEIKLQFSS